MHMHVYMCVFVRSVRMFASQWASVCVCLWEVLYCRFYVLRDASLGLEWSIDFMSKAVECYIRKHTQRYWTLSKVSLFLSSTQYSTANRKEPSSLCKLCMNSYIWHFTAELKTDFTLIVLLFISKILLYCIFNIACSL